MIVDEEQRFGVAQKELLRALRLEVDVLALTATPIPRTLHMSLSGLRDISVIETPPEGRRPIRTLRRRVRRGARQAGARARGRARGAGVLPAQPRRDDRRGGRAAAPALPGACASSSRTARCASTSSSSRCSRSSRGDADVLVSTTIIESGLDIPQANTLIVERADALGLAQLYQIRGRVGRSRRARARLPLLPRRARALPGGARAARHARRPHRARRGLPDRDARPRDPRRGRPARRRAVRPRRRARLRALRRAAERGGRRARPGSGGRSRGRCGSTRGSTRTSRRATSAPRRSRSTCTAGSRSPRPRTSCASCAPRPRTGSGRSRAGRAPVRDPGGEAQARLLGADFLVYRGGRATVGPLLLGSDELRELRTRVDTAVYIHGASVKFRLRTETSPERVAVVDAILEARRAA